MANKFPAGTLFFTGHGQATNWSDPNNWMGGVAPSATSGIAVLPMSATLNGSFTANAFMMLGSENVTVNGTINTMSTNACTSFMVCAGAVATFTPTAVLNDAGGLIVGNASNGVMVAQGSGSQHATLHSNDGRIAIQSTSSGNLTLDNAVWTDTQNLFDGLAGQGSLSVTDGSQVTVGMGLYIGSQAGGSGSLTLSNGAHVTVGQNAVVGGGAMLQSAGTGTMTVGANSVFTDVNALWVTHTGAVNLSGGTINITQANMGLDVMAGGTVSGFGTVNVTVPNGQNISIIDNGVIQASGGTLSLNGWVNGGGTLQIGAGSTLAINTAHIGLPGIGFVGSNGSLVLANGQNEHAPITGFTDGDKIIEAGIDHMGFNASTDVMTLSSGGTVVDTLQFAGAYASNAFTLSQTSAGAMITVHTGH